MMDSLSEREQALGRIEQKLAALTESPLFSYRERRGYLPVPGQGNPQAKIMLVGEAPGEKEAKTGKPFVGPSGKFLDELLHSISLNRKDIFITNIVKDRPPDNRDPTPEEIAIYAPLLLEQIQIIQPEVIVTLGRFAMSFVFEQFDVPAAEEKISRVHGQVFLAHGPSGEFHILPLYHPAVALYNLNQRKTLEEDIQGLKAFLHIKKGKEPPGVPLKQE
jgi:DNA polymerase